MNIIFSWLLLVSVFSACAMQDTQSIKKLDQEDLGLTVLFANEIQDEIEKKQLSEQSHQTLQQEITTREKQEDEHPVAKRSRKKSWFSMFASKSEDETLEDCLGSIENEEPIVQPEMEKAVDRPSTSWLAWLSFGYLGK